MRKLIGITFRVLTCLSIILLTIGCDRANKGLASGEESEEVKQQRQTISQYIGIWSSGEVDLVDELFHPDFIRQSSNASMTSSSGTDGMKKVIQQFRQAYSDIRVTLDEQIYTGDKAVIRWTISAVNTGAGFIHPTGKAITLSGVSILNFSEGLISAEYAAADNLDLYQQLGFTMVPPETVAREASGEDTEPE